MAAAPAAGAFLGALFSGWVKSVRRTGRAILVAVLAWGLAITAFGLVTVSFPLALVCLAIAGAADVFSAVFRSSLVQLETPDNLRGRVTSIHILVVTSGPRLGDIEAAVVAAITTPAVRGRVGWPAVRGGGGRRGAAVPRARPPRDRTAGRGDWLRIRRMGSVGDVPRLPHRVTVVGGGFAGLYAARNLGIDPEVRLTLVDRRNFHLFQPLLYQVATGALSPGDIAQPLRSILRKHRNTTVILGEAVGIDPDRREVILADGGPIAYDTLVVATGAHHTYFDHPDWAAIAPGLKTVEDATEIRRRILIAFEAAEREADPELRRAWMTFVIVGGGPTGVELGGALGEIAHDTLRRDFRAIRSGEARIVLVEAMDRILPPYPPDRSVSAQRQLERLGVQVRTRTRVIDLDETGVRVTGPDGAEEWIASRTVLWAAGVLTARFARTVAAATGASTDRAGRVIVGPDLTIPGHPEIFVVGDAAVEPWKPDKPTPGVAQGAMQGGGYAARGHPPARARAALRAVPLQRPRRRGRHRAAVGRHQHPVARPVRAPGRLHRLAAVARHPHLLSDRLLEPDRRPRPLGMDVPDPRPGHPADHRRGAAATDRGARAAGPGAARSRGGVAADR